MSLISKAVADVMHRVTFDLNTQYHRQRVKLSQGLPSLILAGRFGYRIFMKLFYSDNARYNTGGQSMCIFC